MIFVHCFYFIVGISYWNLILKSFCAAERVMRKIYFLKSFFSHFSSFRWRLLGGYLWNFQGKGRSPLLLENYTIKFAWGSKLAFEWNCVFWSPIKFLKKFHVDVLSFFLYRVNMAWFFFSVSWDIWRKEPKTTLIEKVFILTFLCCCFHYYCRFLENKRVQILISLA